MIENVKSVNIENEIRGSFLDYSMSVIVSRALPDVRDGLKPVHRRILFAMHGLKNFHNKPYLKSARIVGEVIGKYHPHGDASVYDAMVRLAQDFSLRYPMVDGQGNFGSVDGDSAAAMRYTESRMQELSEYLLQDLDKDTVDFVPNYDNKDTEPVVLPAKVPQLLINGTSGIAVGMASNIPPHNLNEVLDGLEALISNPAITVDELTNYIKGPDFPTAGEIHGVAGIKHAYKTGRGSLSIRAKARVEEYGTGGSKERIVVSQIPFQVNKARLIEKIADLVRNKKLEGISDLRDESAKNEIRIVIEIKRGDSGEIVLNNLYKLTQMQISFGMNLVSLVNGLPKQLGLKEILSEFYKHRREVILRRTSYLLRKSEEKAHILLGLKIAVENVDSVVQLIRSAENTQSAHRELVQKYELTDIQAKSVLEMRLARLTGLEREKIVQEYNEIMKEIEDLRDILRTGSRVTQIILGEISDVRSKFADERKTEIHLSSADDFSMESLIADDEVAVTISRAGYVKRTTLTSISTQKRGGKGKSGMLTKEEDIVQNVFITSNHQSLLCFTDKGRVYSLKVYQIPEAGLRSKGKHFANLIRFDSGERVVSVLPVKNFHEGLSVQSVTKNGFIKKTQIMAFANVRSSGIIGLKLDENDVLIGCVLTSREDDILIATKLGKAIRFKEADVRSMGRASRGVTGIRFSEPSDEVIGIEVLRPGSDSTILSVCENGFGKRTPMEEYRVQSRGGKGIYTIKVTERNGPVIGISQVGQSDEMMIMTSSGKIMRFKVGEIGVIGRLTQGVRLINLEAEEQVISLDRVPGEASEQDAPEEGAPVAEVPQS